MTYFVHGVRAQVDLGNIDSWIDDNLLDFASHQHVMVKIFPTYDWTLRWIF